MELSLHDFAEMVAAPLRISPYKFDHKGGEGARSNIHKVLQFTPFGLPGLAPLGNSNGSRCQHAGVIFPELLVKQEFPSKLPNAGSQESQVKTLNGVRV